MDSYLTGWNANDLIPQSHFPFSAEHQLALPGRSDSPVEDAFLEALRFQHTIAQTVELRGFGFWTGEDIRLEFRPAPKDTGLCFVRTDLPGSPRIPVQVELRDDKPRQTSLVLGEARVDMIEHLISVFAALKIDNCEIHIDRPEIPGMDGSADPFLQVLKSAKRMVQPAIRPMRVVLEPFRVEDGNTFIEVKPLKVPATIYRYHLDYGEHSSIGRQDFSLTLSEEAYRREVASSRTFLLKNEADYLVSLGLCKRVSPKDVLVFGEDGPIENALRFENECARHKVLDMVGDFALAPCDWVGEFYGHFSGHHLNARCVKELYSHSVVLDEKSLSPEDPRMRQIQETLG